MTDPNAIAQYVDASTAILDLHLVAEARERVIVTLSRTASIVAPLMAFDLPVEIESAEVYTLRS